jgi:hypothetical protein
MARTVEFTWDTDLNKLAKELNADLGKVKRKVTLDLFTKIVRRTPVDTGRLRGNWAVGDGSPPQGTTENTGVPIPTATLSDFGPAYIVNNLPYAVRIEYGYSNQAPSGMVRLALAELDAELKVLRKRI